MRRIQSSNETVIFRRYRKGKNGKVYDAHAYGLKAWPIRIPQNRPKK